MAFPADHPEIYLVGFRGTGKSTIAPLLACVLDRAWVDLDQALVERHGRTIADLWADPAVGEPGFRELEARLLSDVPRFYPRAVVATGGGVVLRPDNRARLADGLVVWLTASVDELVNRLEAQNMQAQRPRLSSKSLHEEVAEALAVRGPFYREVADLAVETGGRKPADVTHEIVSWLSQS